jgi:hypothetical protein
MMEAVAGINNGTSSKTVDGDSKDAEKAEYINIIEL